MPVSHGVLTYYILTFALTLLNRFLCSFLWRINWFIIKHLFDDLSDLYRAKQEMQNLRNTAVAFFFPAEQPGGPTSNTGLVHWPWHWIAVQLWYSNIVSHKKQQETNKTIIDQKLPALKCQTLSFNVSHVTWSKYQTGSDIQPSLLVGGFDCQIWNYFTTKSTRTSGGVGFHASPKRKLWMPDFLGDTPATKTKANSLGYI